MNPATLATFKLSRAASTSSNMKNGEGRKLKKKVNTSEKHLVGGTRQLTEHRIKEVKADFNKFLHSSALKYSVDREVIKDDKRGQN